MTHSIIRRGRGTQQFIQWLWANCERARRCGDELAADWWGDWWWEEALKTVRQVHTPDFWSAGTKSYPLHVTFYVRAEVQP